MARRRARASRPRPGGLSAFAALLFAAALAACEAREPTALDHAGAPDPAFAERLELLTGGARADEALPLVVALHGLGDTPRGLSGLFADFDRKARVVLPRAPTTDGRTGSWFPVPWDSGGEPAFERGVADAAARLARLLEALPGERPTVGRPVLTGFSQGGILTFAVATSRPELVSTALPLAGMLPRQLWPRALPRGAAGTPLRALHGSRDELLPPGPTEALVAHLRELGFDAALRVYPDAGHFVTDAMLREYHALLREAVERAAAKGASSGTGRYRHGRATSASTPSRARTPTAVPDPAQAPLPVTGTLVL